MEDIVDRLQRCTPYGLDDATVLIDTAAEIKRLRFVIDVVLRAIDDKGSHPEYHDEVRRRHEREWPVLWRALAAIREARRG